MPEHRDRAVVEALGDKSPAGERHRRLVDHLLAGVRERGRKAGDDRFHRGGGRLVRGPRHLWQRLLGGPASEKAE